MRSSVIEFTLDWTEINRSILGDGILLPAFATNYVTNSRTIPNTRRNDGSGAEISKAKMAAMFGKFQYEPGSQYREFVRKQAWEAEPVTPDSFTFEPYCPDTK